MSSVGFEPTTPAIKRLQTYALDRTVTEICSQTFFPAPAPLVALQRYACLGLHMHEVS